VLAAGGELLDHVVTGVADVHAALRRALGAVDRDARRIGELPGARADDARLAGRLGLADLALLLAVLDAPSPDGFELPLLVEPLDTRIRAVGDVHLAATLIDRHPDRGLEQAGGGAGAAELADLDQERHAG